MRRKVLSLVLALCMVLSLMPMTAFAAPGDTFNDVDGHWGQSAIERWSEYGVVNGDGTGGFAPDKQMTRAEFATMLANMLGYKDKAANTFADVNDSDWFADAILKLAAAGVIQGSNGMANPNAPISRQEAAVMMCRAFNIPTTGGNLDFADSADVADWAKGAVAALADRGMMNGVGNNNVAPLADINRASVATLLDNMITEYVTEDKTITGEVSGIVLVAADATVTVENATLNENLIVAPKADGAEVALTGTTTASDVVVGAAATVKVDSNATAGEVQATTNAAVTVAGKVDAVGGNASVSVTETGKVDNVAGSDVTVEKGAAVKDVAADKVTVAQGASVESVVCNNVTVEKDASVGSLTLTDASAKAEVSGTVKNVTVQENATGATVNTNSGATVGKVETAAKDVTVSGNGKVENVTATGGTANVTTPGTNVENKTDNKDNVTNNGKPVEPSTGGETPTPPSGGNSGNSGGGGTTYAVTIGEITNGTVTANPTSAAAGRTVTLNVVPDTDYVLDSVTVTDADAGTVEVVNNTTFTMPAKAVTVTATFKKLPTLTVSAMTNSEGVWNQALANIQDGIVVGPRTGNASPYTFAVTGVSKYISNWPDFSSNANEQSGNYVWLGFTMNLGDFNDAVATFKSTDNANKPLVKKDHLTEDLVWRTSEQKNPIVVTITYGSSNEKITYNIDLSGLELAAADATTVSFDSQGGSSVGSKIVPADGKIVPPTSTRTGYSLAGWATAADGTALTVADGKITVPNETSKLYAKWTANTYTIAFDLKGGTGTANNIANVAYDSASDLTLPVDPTREGYTFKEWNTNPDGTGTKLQANTKNLTAVNGATVTVYAIWQKVDVPSTATFTTISSNILSVYNAEGSSFKPGFPASGLSAFVGGTLSFTPGTNTESTKIAVTGTLNKITNNWTGFNGAKEEEQTGYYLPLMFAAPEGITNATQNVSIATVNGSREKTFTASTLDPDGNTYYFSCFLYVDTKEDNGQTVAANNPTFTINWGEGYSATTYTLNLSGLTLKAADAGSTN